MEAFTGTVENPGSGAFMVQEPPFRPPIPSTGMGGKLMLTLVELYFIFQILFSSPIRVFPDGGGRVGVFIFQYPAGKGAGHCRSRLQRDNPPVEGIVP